MSSSPATATHERPLSGDERRAVAMLGIPTLALALSVTVITTYLPVVAEGFGGSTVTIGVIIGIEGLVALWLPLLAGTWSDRLRTPLGGRLPFLLAGTPALVVALVALGLVQSIGLAALLLLLFFGAYFACYEPYRALYPDLIDDDNAGRAQS